MRGSKVKTEAEREAGRLHRCCGGSAAGISPAERNGTVRRAGRVVGNQACFGQHGAGLQRGCFCLPSCIGVSCGLGSGCWGCRTGQRGSAEDGGSGGSNRHSLSSYGKGSFSVTSPQPGMRGLLLHIWAKSPSTSPAWVGLVLTCAPHSHAGW